MSRPPVLEKVDVAVLKLIPFVSPMERSEPGVVVPTPRFVPVYTSPVLLVMFVPS